MKRRIHADSASRRVDTHVPLIFTGAGKPSETVALELPRRLLSPHATTVKCEAFGLLRAGRGQDDAGGASILSMSWSRTNHVHLHFSVVAIADHDQVVTVGRIPFGTNGLMRVIAYDARGERRAVDEDLYVVLVAEIDVYYAARCALSVTDGWASPEELGKVLAGRTGRVAAAQTIAWACYLTGNSTLDSEYDSEDDGDADCRGVQGCVQEKIGPSDALIRAMVEQYVPQVSNADLAGWILFAVHSRRTQNIRAVIDGICGTVEDVRTLGVAATTNFRRFSSRRLGESTPLALVRAIGPDGEEDNALHAAARLSDGRIACVLLACGRPWIAVPRDWHEPRSVPRMTPYETAMDALVTADREHIRRHPAVMVEAICIQGVGLARRCLTQSASVLKGGSDTDTIAREARRIFRYVESLGCERVNGEGAGAQVARNIDVTALDTNTRSFRARIALLTLCDRGEVDTLLKQMMGAHRSAAGTKGDIFHGLAARLARAVACMVPDSDVSALTAHHIAGDGWSREVTERHMRERLATQRASPTTDVIFMIVALCTSLCGLLRINNWMVGSFFASIRSILQTPHMAATFSALLSLITFSVWNQTHDHGVFTPSKTTRKGGEEWRSRYIWSRETVICTFRLLLALMMLFVGRSSNALQWSSTDLTCSQQIGLKSGAIPIASNVVSTFCAVFIVPVRIERFLITECAHIPLSIAIQVTICDLNLRRWFPFLMLRIFALALPAATYLYVNERNFRARAALIRQIQDTVDGGVG